MHTQTKTKSSGTIGFDTLMAAAASIAQGAGANYPPYNIVKKSDTKYQVILAVAGFDASEVEITHDHETLTVKGRKGKEDKKVTYIHRGLSQRDFERKFALSEYSKPSDAEIKDGLLTITIERILPDEQKTRKLKIKTV